MNSPSLLSKLDNLQALHEVVNEKYDVIAVSETWKTDLNDQLLHISGYKKIFNKRCDGRMRGGVALFVKNSIDFAIKTADNTNTFESIFIELSCKYKLKHFHWCYLSTSKHRIIKFQY